MQQECAATENEGKRFNLSLGWQITQIQKAILNAIAKGVGKMDEMHVKGNIPWQK